MTPIRRRRHRATPLVFARDRSDGDGSETRKATTMALPPGPTQHPLLQTLRWIRAPLTVLHECRARFGDTFTLNLAGLGTFVHFSSPSALKQIFTGDPAVLHAGEANEPLAPLLGEQSVLRLDEADHMRQRRLLLPPFHGERMHAYAEVMRDATDAAIDRWPLGAPFALHGPMHEITLAVIMRAVFGITEGPRADAVAAMVSALIDRAQTPWVLLKVFRRDWPGTPWRDFVRLRARADEVLFAEIARRRAEGAAGDAREDVLALLLAVLLAARHEDGSPMSDGELRDELLTMLVAGHETTASTLAWAFERLLANPAVLARAQAELARVVGDGPLSPAHLPRLEYLDAIVKETLRLRPIVPLTARKTTARIEIGGYELPAGQMLGASIYLAHRREETYPEPDAFRPERWEGAKPDPYAWLPFGGGVRRCIGMAFAQYEMKVVLATTLLRARLRRAPGEEARMVRRGITLVPSDGTRVVLDARAPR
jgi:cytochrome P450